jgi:two-component system nitrogen regulation sensor histidine kinase NtrY
MTRDLRTGHEQLELSADKLREQNVEIEERRRYMETVLKNVSAGVITIDADGLVRTFNPSAQKMLNIDADEVLDKSYKNLLKGLNLNIARDIVDALSSTRNEAAHIPLRLAIDGRPRSFLAYVNALTDEAGNRMGIVMVIDDLTELEKAQRMAAWREVARRIAHEVKNPLTPISLSAQRLKRRYSAQVGDTVFEECTQMIINHVELIRNLVNEFSTFARFPTADLKPDALAPIIDDTVALYREGHPQIEFKIDIEDDLPDLNLDRQQTKQALINLLDNAVAAIRNRGQIAITVIHDPILKLVRMEVADNGSGITDEDKSRLFEPNFSTKKSGMGLGLTIVNSIITDHNGVIRVQDNQPRGAKFVIELPTT